MDGDGFSRLETRVDIIIVQIFITNNQTLRHGLSLYGASLPVKALFRQMHHVLDPCKISQPAQGVVTCAQSAVSD